METLKIIPLFLISLLFFGCNDDSDTHADFEISGKWLEQTVWNGSYKLYENGININERDIRLFFKTETEGEYFETKPDSSLYNGKINYKADKNMISFENTSGNIPLSGDWLITEKSKERLVLKKNLGYEPFNYTMTLKKIY